MISPINDSFLIGLVGPCGSGKTTLTALLTKEGYQARPIAQEHSFVPSMWQKITNPDFLVFLDASYLATKMRRQLDWTENEYLEQHRRLDHARAHADLYIMTDPLSPDQVLEIILKNIQTTFAGRLIT